MNNRAFRLSLAVYLFSLNFVHINVYDHELVVMIFSLSGLGYVSFFHTR